MQGGEYSTRYDQIQLLGRNSQDDSQMYLVKDTLATEYRMAKKLSLDNSSLEDQTLLLNQVSMLKQLSHPHIIRYHDILLQGDCLSSILQFCQEGDLGHYLQKKKSKKESFSQKLLLSWVMQLLMGLEYIHNKHIIHRLIASPNVYLNHQGDLKIGSFGSAKVLENTLKRAVTVVTAPCNMSPEMVQGHPYSTKADIWALGCLIFQMTSFKPLFTYNSLPQLYDLIVESNCQELPAKYGKYLNPLYRRMMKKNPNQRPSATELLQEEVFVSLMKQYIKKKKIDSLDLKYLVPKRLTIHKNKSKKKEPIKLPPISPSQNSHKKDYKTKSKFTSPKTEQAQQKRSLSKQRKRSLGKQDSESRSSVKTSSKVEDNQEVGERITVINEKEGYTISKLCQTKLNQILEKYKPHLGQIYEKTFEFEDFEQFR